MPDEIDGAAGEQMWFRIGLHVGNIMVQNDNLFGDAVNVAARLEARSRVAFASRVLFETM